MDRYMSKQGKHHEKGYLSLFWALRENPVGGSFWPGSAPGGGAKRESPQSYVDLVQQIMATHKPTVSDLHALLAALLNSESNRQVLKAAKKLCICIIGLVGNGIVICLLGFHIKRSPFTTYVLNLAVADFGVLLLPCLGCILELFNLDFPTWFPTWFSLFLIVIPFALMYEASQLLLTAIGIDRCLSVLFPIWHRCHRPPHLSTIVCALMWVLVCLPLGILAIVNFRYFKKIFLFCPFIVGTFLCLPLVTISTAILLFKVFWKSQQPQKGKPLTLVLLTLLFFLIFAIPLNAMIINDNFTDFEHFTLRVYGGLCICLNSCVNPVIYYLVGRKKRGQQWQSMKGILQRAFKEEERQREEQGTIAETNV
uniref:mas-related G-protein coupled receptor member H-like n=1 Tax=Euleptes europaea TaxID=460621 RepID=UPI002541A5C8|nr:mas-related G-protein coupled receptor member H-like [Euleptes europaea]